MVERLMIPRPVIPVNNRETQASFFKFVRKIRTKTADFRGRRGAETYHDQV
jgi:hypothetical protein